MSRLVLDGVRAGYGETRVLRGVDLSVAPAEVHALVGRNGAGKTTTLRCVTGVVEPTAGQIRFDGQDVTDTGPTATAAAGIGFVPEERRVFPGLTVAENLRVASHGGESRWTIEAVYDAFDSLAQRRDRPATQLSGGEQQMLAVARALVAGADTLLLDEPTEGLAPTVVDRVVEIVEQLRENGVGVLFVEQNVSAARRVADRVSILDRGEIVFEGTPAELADAPDVRDRHLGVSG